VKRGGLAFNSEIAKLRVSVAKAGDVTAGNVRVSMLPIGTLSLGFPWQPFMDTTTEHGL